MEQLDQLLSQLSTPLLLFFFAGTIAVLGKSADRLVHAAVTLSEAWGLPKVVIGATVVSLGTTAPEAAVSVLASVRGNPGLALGNAVGSVICDTGLILGLSCLLGQLPLEHNIVRRQGRVSACEWDTARFSLFFLGPPLKASSLRVANCLNR